MKIYVGGTFKDQKRLRAEAAKLMDEGHEITGSWLQESCQPHHLTYDEWMLQLGLKDVAEVVRADCLITDLDGESTSGGRYVEWGVASHPSSTMLRFLVGGKMTDKGSLPYGCFNYLAHKHFKDWAEVHEYMKGRK